MSEQSERKEVFIGIDVSKATLEIHARPGGQSWQVNNDAPGRNA